MSNEMVVAAAAGKQPLQFEELFRETLAAKRDEAVDAIRDEIAQNFLKDPE